MGTIVNFSKLAKLRAKTDRDLVRILDSDIDRGLALGNVAATRQSTFYEQAEKVYSRTIAILARASSLHEDETAGLERKLRELRMALDLVPAARDAEDVAVLF